MSKPAQLLLTYVKKCAHRSESNQSSLRLLMSPHFGWWQINVCWYQLGQEPGTDPAGVANEKTVWCVWHRGRRNHFQISPNNSQESPSQQHRTETHRRCTHVQNARTKTDYIGCKCDVVQVSSCSSCNKLHRNLFHCHRFSRGLYN